MVNEPTPDTTMMSALAIRPHPSYSFTPRDVMLETPQASGMSSRLRLSQDRVELPSIRQAIPELDLGSSSRDRSSMQRYESTSYSPTFRMSGSEESIYTSPTLKKRSRESLEDNRAPTEVSEMAKNYRSPPRHSSYPQSSPRRQPNNYSADTDSSAEISPYHSSQSLPSMRPVSGFESPARNDFRPTLPSLPSLINERCVASDSDQQRGSMRWPDTQIYPQPSSPSFRSSTSQSSYGAPCLQYGYQQPGNQPYLGSGGVQSQRQHVERSPFTSSAYQSGYHEGLYEMGAGVFQDTNKQRKRRGNLPKETTDKLRAWFVTHLQHPYPTEDEKQELMEQTGLQMNQISNWFINARRRQLPTMISNARAESKARSTRLEDGGLLDYDDVKQSEGEGGFEDYL